VSTKILKNRKAAGTRKGKAIDASGADGMTRRCFVQTVGAGLLIAVSEVPALAQARRGGRRGGRGGGGGFGGRPAPIAARVHFEKDGNITVLTGKVEVGQGSRAEITEAAAEELHVAPRMIRLVMADTDLVPDDGITAGSGTTPRTIPAVRAGCAAARQALMDVAARKWNVDPSTVEVKDGQAVHAPSGQHMAYAELASDPEAAKLLAQVAPAGVLLTPVAQWKTLGTSVLRPNGHDIVTGQHEFASDITRPGMLFGRILRQPSYGAKLLSIDLAPAQAMKDVIVAREGDFVGVAAPTLWEAGVALAELEKTAKWEMAPHPSSATLYQYLREHAQVPANPYASKDKGDRALKQTYDVAYIQHAPMEPRTAVAEWKDGKLTVWTGTQNPFGTRTALAQAFGLEAQNVRVIVPDTGGGFGGKHTPECAIETARLAKAVGKPVRIRWTRAEEFIWAYFRPAGVIDLAGTLDDNNRIANWYQLNINSGGNAVDTPYNVPQKRTQSVNSAPPLRHGSYRGLAATANNFARECFMDELAALAAVDPLTFRRNHLEEGSRIRNVLEEAAKHFKFTERLQKKEPNVGVGLACGTEKGSYVAACAEVAVDLDKGSVVVRQVCQAYECGAILNPGNLLSQVQGAIMMGIGAALREEMKFENGKITNASFWTYLVPRFDDLPELDIHLVDRKDLPPAGAGETPIICIAPAIANAVFHAVGTRVRSMPIRLQKA